MNKTNIFIADDHPMVIDALQNQIKLQSDNFELVGFAHDGEQTLAKLAELDVDILILDISMPVMDGTEVLKIVREKYPRLKVLILTMLDDLKHIQEMLMNGAKGYVLKNKSTEYIITALTDIRDGKEFVQADVAQIAVRDLMPSQETAARNNKDTILKSIRSHEAELLGWLTLDFAAKEIAVKMNKSNSTIETWKKNLMKKTGAKSEKGLVRFAIENGFVK